MSRPHLLKFVSLTHNMAVIVSTLLISLLGSGVGRSMS